MTLPYENATSGRNATGDMQEILRAFGATSFGVMEDFNEGKVIAQFEWRGRRISIAASAKGYAAAWLRHHPWSNRMRTDRSIRAPKPPPTLNHERGGTPPDHPRSAVSFRRRHK